MNFLIKSEAIQATAVILVATQLLQLLQAVPAIAKAAGGFIASQKEFPEPAGLRESLQALANARAWSQAALNPDHPYFRTVEEAEGQKSRLALIDAIRAIVNQNNLAAAKGVTPVAINPARRDETVWKTLSRGFMESKINARNSARDFLLKSSGAQTAAANAYYRPMLMSYGINQFNRASSFGGQQGLFDALGQVARLFKNQGPSNTGATTDTGWGPRWWDNDSPAARPVISTPDRDPWGGFYY